MANHRRTPDESNYRRRACLLCGYKRLRPDRHYDSSDRSQEPITQADLARLAEIARTDRERMFVRNPRWALYRDHLLAVALCPRITAGPLPSSR